MSQIKKSFREASARQRVSSLCDPNSFKEWLGPDCRLTSPHLLALGSPVSFDDGVVVGEGRIQGRSMVIVAQEGQFNGGAVGEVHGAKIRGALLKAIDIKATCVVLVVDSGGVRLHEANAGLIAISEIMRAVFAVQDAAIPVIALVGGTCGAFGGMGIVTRLCDVVIMSEEGRMGLSGPEVIETVKGVDEFDSKDRALVWRVTGGKIRRTLGEAQRLVEDDMQQFKQALEQVLSHQSRLGFSLSELKDKQQSLTQRRLQDGAMREGNALWKALGLEGDLSLMGVDEFNRRLEDLHHD